jgi:hypothetical protein
MNDKVIDPDTVMRLNVHLVRDEYPELFDELKKFNKGIKRIQRLKTLANERMILGGRLLLNDRNEGDPATSKKKATVVEEALASARDAFGPLITEQ